MRWAEPTPERVEYIAANLRRQDVLEVAYSHGISGREAVYDSWAASSECRCIDGDDGVPVGICGVTPQEETHLIWLLATDGLLATSSHQRQFLRGGRRWVDGVIDRLVELNGYAVLENWVFAKNVDSVRWLRHLGFEVFPPTPMGPGLQLFSHFRRSR